MRGRVRLCIWGTLAAALGVGLGQLPLFGVLGFELATAAALFAAVMGLDLGSAFARERQRGGATTSMRGATLRAMARAVGVMMIPAAIAAVRGLWTPTCDWGFGLETYLAMPMLTAALAGAMGHALGVVCGPRRFVGAAIAQLPAVGVVLAALWRFYSEPPVFSYNAILGYFPGNLYDENIQLRWPLVWSRLDDVAWVALAVGAVALAFDPARHRVRWRRAPDSEPRPRTAAFAWTAIAFVVGCALHLDGGALGFAVNASDIERELDGKIETAHFIIHYAHSEDIDDNIAAIAEDHEFRYAEVVAQLGVAPPGKLRSFYFADAGQKARWFGARDVEMAKPWRREIYLDHRSFPHGSLRHEIAHAVASAFGDPWFGVAAKHHIFANPGLIEGLAVAVDWPGGYERPTPHESVRALAELGIQPSLGQLLSLEFFSVSSARGYTTAGSFLRYLLDTYGAAKLRALYGSGGDFEAAYGKPIRELEAGWRTLIEQIHLAPDVIEAQKERFRGVSVFARPCPHAIAKWREKAGRALGHGDRDTALDWLREICAASPGEPRHTLALADVLAVGNAVERAQATALWLGLVGDHEHVTSTLRVEVLERLARDAARRGDREAVIARIHEAFDLSIDSNERRQLDAEAFTLLHPGPAADALYTYFFLPGPIPPIALAQWAVIAEPSLGFAHYLLGLQHTLSDHWAIAAEELSRALDLELPGPQFARNAARRLALAGYRAHDRAKVERAIAVLRGPKMTTPDRFLADDWQARLDFDAKQPR